MIESAETVEWGAQVLARVVEGQPNTLERGDALALAAQLGKVAV